jgi:hypothetical protein
MKRKIEMAIAKHNGRGGNLNRNYRTLYSLVGNSRIHLIDSTAKLKGNLYSAKDAHELIYYDDMADFAQRNNFNDTVVLFFHRKAKLELYQLQSFSASKKLLLYFEETYPLKGIEHINVRVDMVNNLELISCVILGIACNHLMRL